MSNRATLLKPPAEDPTKSRIENVLDITEIGILGPDIFTNTRPPWHPPGARGIFGGAVIAQSLAAGQRTVPAQFTLHSCHCYFLLAGSSSIPILFHVERVRDGRSFAARTVQARQRGRCIFTVTMSFVREGSGGEKEVRHAQPMPENRKFVDPPWESADAVEEPKDVMGAKGPWVTSPMEITNEENAQERKCRQWVKARGKISPGGGYEAHVNALAYMSDSYFIGTVARIHDLWRLPFSPSSISELTPEMQQKVQKLYKNEGMDGKNVDWAKQPELGMIVSLDHSIYFHEPRKTRADEWMLSEMQSPWAGDGRGVVTQRIFGRDGMLLATCVQEGVIRLKQDEAEAEAETGGEAKL